MSRQQLFKQMKILRTFWRKSSMILLELRSFEHTPRINKDMKNKYLDFGVAFTKKKLFICWIWLNWKLSRRLSLCFSISSFIRVNFVYILTFKQAQWTWKSKKRSKMRRKCWWFEALKSQNEFYVLFLLHLSVLFFSFRIF
jgi:hypothetical protein